MTFGERLTELRTSAGYIKRNEFADKLGIPSTTLRNYETDAREPGHTFLKQISELFNVSVDYLLGLTDDKEVLSSFRLKSSEYEHIKKYRLISEEDPDGKTLVDSTVDYLCKKIEAEFEREKQPSTSAPTALIEINPKKNSNVYPLPYFRAGVSAGSGIFILGNEAEDKIEIPNIAEYKDADYAIDVNGRSMEPLYEDGDIVLVSQRSEIRAGDIGVFIVNGNAFIKELGKGELISHNPDFPNITIHEGDNVVCMGKVIGKLDD